MPLAAEAGGWWIALWGVWALTLSAFSLAETVTAAVVTAPAAAAAVAARRAERVAWHPAASARAVLRCVAVWPAAVVCDTVRVVAAALTGRGGSGAVTEVRLPPGRAESTAARGAFTTLALGSTPSSVVVDVPRGDRLRVHGLAAGPPRLGRWAR